MQNPPWWGEGRGSIASSRSITSTKRGNTNGHIHAALTSVIRLYFSDKYSHFCFSVKPHYTLGGSKFFYVAYLHGFCSRIPGENPLKTGKKRLLICQNTYSSRFFFRGNFHISGAGRRKAGGGCIFGGSLGKAIL